MPFYDYKCTKCNLIFEIQKGMAQISSPPCPKCGSATNRVFYAPRITKSAADVLDESGSEQSGACNTCTSGVCSSCNVR